MSKNVCSTCKHYERVNDNEPEDHGDCTLYPIWVDVWAAHYCGQWTTANSTSEEIPALDIDWSKVPEAYDWVAQDSNGDIYAYTEAPEDCIDDWMPTNGGYAYCLENGHPNPNPNWRNTLTKRPGT